MHSQVDDEFWFVVPELSHRNNYGGIPATLRIATLELEATVTISMPANAYHPTLNPTGFQPIVVNIPANDDAAVDFSHMIDSVGIPRTGLENMALNPSGVNNFGLHITATNMINTYWEVNYDYGADVWTLKGENGLGTEFYTPFQTAYPTRPTPGVQAYSAIDVVATVDGTTVTFELPAGVSARYGSTYNPVAAGGTYSLTLNRGETFSLFPDYINDKAARLAGTRVTSDFPIAVVVKDDAVATPPNGAVVLGDQLVPTDIAGSHYIVPDVWNPNDIYVIATEDNTMIYGWLPDGVTPLPGSPYGPLSAGQQITINVPSGSKFARLTSWLNPGDPSPSFIVYQAAIVNKSRAGGIIPAIGCTGNTQLAFTRARADNIFYFYIIVEQGNEDKFLIDGVRDDGIIDPGKFTKIEGSGGYMALLTTSINSNILIPGQHLIQNTGGIFHLGIMNGFPAGPHARLYYGYYSDFGGLNIGANVAGTNSEVIKTCYGIPVQLYAFGGTQYTWTPDVYLDDAHINMPTAINLPPGVHNYTVEVSGACATGSVVLTVLVSSPVEALFEVNANSGCSPLVIQLDDRSTGNSFWQYDLGDGTPLIRYDLDVATPAIPEPPGYPAPFSIPHTYTNNTTAEIYDTVTLLVKNESGCPDILRKTFVVFPEIHSDFTVQDGIDSGCDPLAVQFQNSSAGDTATYRWEFGDGGSSTEKDPVHVFRNLFGPDDTTFQTRLVAVSPFYCRDTSYHTITVSPYIEANFAFDTVFACTPHEVRITNQSIGADSYFWDFGDGATSTSAGPEISHTYVNNSPVPDTFTVSLRVDNEEGCFEEIQREVIVFPEIHASFQAIPVEGCTPFEVTFQNTSTGAATYFWDFGDGGTSTEVHPVHLYDRSLIDHDTLYRVTLIATSSELCRDTATFNMLIHPYIEAAFSVDDVVGCHPFTITIENQSIGVDQYFWDFGDGSPGSNTSAASFDHTYQNTSGAQVVYPLELIVLSSQGCRDTLVKNITVNTEMTANFSPDVSEGCHPLTVNFIDHSLNAATYSWDFGDGASSAEESPSHTFTNFNSTDTTYTVTLTTSSSDGECVKVWSEPILVHGIVEAEFTIPKALDCTPFKLSFENLTVGGTSFTWDFGDGTTLDTTTTNPVSHTFTNSDFYNIASYEVVLQARNAAGCTGEFRKTVRVYPDIRSSFGASPTEGCHPLNVTFENFSDGEQTYVWHFGDGAASNLSDPVHTYTNTGTSDSIYTVELITIASNNVCKDTSWADITVFPYVEANFSIPVKLGCNPFDVVLENSSVNGSSYYWDFGDGNDTTTLNTDPIIHRFSNSSYSVQQDYVITLTAENNAGCTAQISRTITVEPDIHAEFSANQVQGCHPLEVDFYNQSSGASYYHWDFGDGNTSSLADPSQTFTNIGTTDSTYRVWMYAYAPNHVCRDSFMLSIVVHPYVEADFSIQYTEQCTPAEVIFSNSSRNGQDYSWDFNGTPYLTTSLAPINRQFINASTTDAASFPVELIVTSPQGCKDSITKQVTVHHDIVAGFTNITEGCHPLTVAFTNNSLGAVEHNWEFGDNSSSTLISPVHIYNNFSNSDSVLSVRLTVTSENLCRDTAYSQITVHPVPKAKFTVNEIVDCSPLEITIANNSEAGDIYTWDFGDGTQPLDTTTKSPISYSYTNDMSTVQVYQLRLDVRTSFGCADSLTQNLTVYPSVSVDFERDSAGCSPYTSSFVNNSQRAATYVWDFGDGTKGYIMEPGHTFVNDGVNDSVFQVELRGFSQYGCEDSITKTVTVYPSPEAKFDYTPIYQYFPSATVTLVNESTPGNYTYAWDFDDGGTSAQKDPVSHTYAHWGEYNIKLSVSNVQCTDSVVHWIKIFPPQPIAAFEPDIDTGCVPLRVSFTNNSLYGKDYFWEFDDGGTSTAFEPTHTFDDPGYYQVKLTVTGEGGEDFAFHEIQAFRLPIPDFIVEPTLVMLPDQPVKSFNFSKHGASYLWDFGDGTTYRTKDTLHQYTETGVYDVSLTVWTDKGCEASLYKPEAVTVIGKRLMMLPNAFAPSVSGPSGGWYNPNDVSNEIFFPVHDGVIEYYLMIYNRWGEMIFETHDVNQGWDGYCGSERCTEDVYIWKVEVKYSNGTQEVLVGDVTLLHKRD